MKKFYSIVLMAAALLIGTNVWADDITVVNQTSGASKSCNDLQEAIDFIGAGQTGTITLNNTITLDAAVVIPSKNSLGASEQVLTRNGQNITLDLNGNNIKGNDALAAGFGCIHLVKGTLNITGTGEIKRPKLKGANNPAKSAITVYGAPWSNRNEVWSELNIGENVTLNSNTVVDGEANKGNANNKVFGLCIQDFSAMPTGYASSDTVSTTGKLGYTNRKSKKVAETAGNPFAPYCAIAGAAKDGKKTWTASCAYGVKVLVEGKIFGHYRGINVLGNINAAPQCDIDDNIKTRQLTAYPYYSYNYPYIKITSTAQVWCIDDGISNDGNGGIYAGGYAVWDISGYVHGQTGILAKSGDFVLTDAVVASDSEKEGANSGEYHKGETAGSGIFIASSASYAGGTAITLQGDTKVSGNGSSAITDVLAENVNGESTVSHITIEGGTIEPGKGGAINLSSDDVEKTTVAGGNIAGIVTVTDDETGEQSTKPIVELTNSENTTVTTVTDENGKTTYVVTPGKSTNIAESANIYTAAKDSVKWTGASETLAGDKELKYLEINEMNGTNPAVQVLTIPAGKTLKVGRVILGYGAQIVVNAGAKLIVTGEQGIVAPVESNIVLKSTATKYATFLFNPAVTSNRHPNATVEYTAVKSFYASATSYQWERFGIPTHNTLTSIECTTTDVWTNIQIFENDAWQDLGWLQNSTFANTARLNKPFIACNLLTERAKTDPVATYVMKGELVGNTDAALNANLEWNPFSNSYTADVDVTALLAGLASGTNVDPTVYLATPTGLGTYSWDAVDPKWVTSSDKVAPMQAFILHNHGTVSEVSTLNYKNMLWTPATSTSAGAPRRFASSNDNTARLRVIVANEQGVWDNVKMTECTVNLHNAAKYMNDDVNIYAMADEKAAIVAAENLENTYVGFSTVNGGKFTISFANVEGREFDLIDLETGARVAVAEGFEYEFTADANSANDYRFKIVERNNVPTAIENTEAVKSATGIYTITGQYMGEMNVWNTLPAGVYVVNGEKVVK